MDSTSPRRIGRYEILDRLGAGGMGELYRALDPLLNRTIAVKVLKVLSTDLRERFDREARSAASLKHTNIVIIHDFGEDGAPLAQAPGQIVQFREAVRPLA